MGTVPHPPGVWTIADVVDFEIHLADDRDSSMDRPAQPSLPPSTDALPSDPQARRRTLLWRWLNQRRAAASSPSPGALITGAWRLLLGLGLLTGGMLGAGVSAGLMHYRGQEPVNVSWFLACTLGLQLVFLGFTFLFTTLRAAGLVSPEFRPLASLMAALVWIGHSGLRRLPGPQRERTRAALAQLVRHRERYGSLAAWPVWILTQSFAIAFNTGVLGTLLIHVTTTDLAFGWQSTLDPGPEAVHRLVSALSLPWSGWAPFPHPTLAQITGSRFTYSGGVLALNPAATTAWWPFLAYAVTFYGLLPRVFLLAWARFRWLQALHRLPFNHADANALYRRLNGPTVHSQSGTATLQPPDVPSSPASPAGPSHGTCLVLISSDLDITTPDLWAPQIHARFGWSVHSALSVRIDHPSGNAQALSDLTRLAPACSAVLVLIRARRSPITAIALFLRQVADAAGSPRETLVVLVAPSSPQESSTLPPEVLRHWRQFLAIHHLDLTVATL